MTLIGCDDATDTQQAAASPDESTRIQLDKGELVGFLAPNSARVWQGIPYAKPPVGDRRWQAPEEVDDWGTPIHATKSASRCVQYTNSLDELEGATPNVLIGSEDCLYLDVYAPSSPAPADGWPVMVWIHGGSNTWGGADQYNGAILADTHNVVVVVPQFRLGPLGWFFHPALNLAADSSVTSTGNFALLDIMASLRWVKDDIAAFNGNPQNVTLFGESAGAFNIYALLTIDNAKPLFDKAIVQSGAAHSDSLQSALNHEFSAEKVIRKIVKGTTPSPADMRNIPVDALYKQYKTEGRIQLPILIADGVTIPKEGIRAFLKNNWQQNGKPIVIGSNRDEANYFFLSEPTLVNQIFGFYPYIKDEDFYASVSEYVNKMWRILMVNTQAEELAQAADHPVFTYRFDWDDEESFYGANIKQLIGASHTVEIPFVFGTFDDFIGKLGEILFVEDNRQDRQLLSAQMMSYWTQFAYTANPDKGRDHQLPKWSAVTKSANQAMRLDARHDKGLGMYDVDLSIVDLIAQIKHDPRLKDATKKCFVATQMDRFAGDVAPRISKFKAAVCE